MKQLNNAILIYSAVVGLSAILLLRARGLLEKRLTS